MRLLSLLIFIVSLKAMATESYQQLNSNVRQYQSRVEDKRRLIKELAEKKSELKDQAAIRAILDEMIVASKELKENFVRFQREKKKLVYQNPQKGDLTERQYRRFELETIEEMNTISNLDLRLKAVLKKIQETYGRPPELVEEERLKNEKLKASAKATEHESVDIKNEQAHKSEPGKNSHGKEDPAKSSRPVLSY